MLVHASASAKAKAALPTTLICVLLHRDGVIAVNKDSSQITDEYLPDQRSHLYGIAIATSHCLSGEKCEHLDII